MKKILSIVMSLVFVLALSMTAFAASAPLEGAVYQPTVTSWYNWDGTDLLDTSINFDFDKINIDDIQWIRFSLIGDDGLVLAQRFSSNKNLDNLFDDCAQYWQCNNDYHQVTGTKTLSCAFRPRHGGNNGYWVSSGTNLVVGQMPEKLLVEVKVGDCIYSCEWNNQGE